MAYGDDDDYVGADVCCPECGEIQPEDEVYSESGSQANETGAYRCLYCRASVDAADWIRD